MIRRCRPALGTLVEIAILDEDVAADVADAALRDAFAAVTRVHARMSYHDAASDLSTMNRDAHARPVAVDRWTFDVLAAATALYAATDGHFDCAVAPLLVAGGVLPSLGTGLAAAGGTWADVVLDEAACTVRYRVPLVVDLGGIAKGFAVDRAIDALAAHGIARAVVNAGGDLRVRGATPVPIHVRPASRDAAPIAVGELADGAFATSWGGARATPDRAPAVLVDARRRRLVDAPRCYSVVAPTCLLADALTKVAATAGDDAATLVASFGATALVH